MPGEKRVPLRVPADLYEAIQQRAQKRVRSVNGELIALLKLGLASEMDEGAAFEKVDQALAQKAKSK